MAGALYFITLVCCILSSAVVLASPFRSRIQNQNSGLAIVDCRETYLMQQLFNAGISFRCLKDTELQAMKEEAVKNTAYEASSLQNELAHSKKSPTKIEFILQSVACVDPKRCGSMPSSQNTILPSHIKNIFFSPKFKKFLKNKCKEGYSFESRLGRCIPENKIIYLQSDSAVPTLSSNVCPSGFEYSPEVDACLSIEDSKFCSFGYVYSAEVDACLPASNANNCPSGYVYSPEVDACLPTKNVHTCPFGYVYSPEVDTCLPIEYRGAAQSLSSSPLVTEKPEEDAAQFSTELVGWAKCLEGQVYVSEIDLCVTPEKPSTPSLQLNDTEEDSSVNSSGKKEKRSAYLSMHPSPDVGIHFRAEAKVGNKKCQKNEIYMSEIDLCVHNDKYSANNYK